MNPTQRKPSICLLAKASLDESWPRHKRLSRLNFKDINKLILIDLVCGHPLLKFYKDHSCDQLQRYQQARSWKLRLLKIDKDHLRVACKMRKQCKKSYSTIVNTKIIQPLELIYIYLCGPSLTKSIGGIKYILVIVDEFSRFS